MHLAAEKRSSMRFEFLRLLRLGLFWLTYLAWYDPSPLNVVKAFHIFRDFLNPARGGWERGAFGSISSKARRFISQARSIVCCAVALIIYGVGFIGK